jgi:hypothetical protein
LTIVSSILWFIVSGWPIGIIKTFLKERKNISLFLGYSLALIRPLCRIMWFISLESRHSYWVTYCIISLRGKVCAHSTDLAPPLFIEVRVTSHGS